MLFAVSLIDLPALSRLGRMVSNTFFHSAGTFLQRQCYYLKENWGSSSIELENLVTRKGKGGPDRTAFPQWKFLAVANQYLNIQSKRYTGEPDEALGKARLRKGNFEVVTYCFFINIALSCGPCPRYFRNCTHKSETFIQTLAALQGTRKSRGSNLNAPSNQLVSNANSKWISW